MRMSTVRAFVTRKLDLFALSPDSGTHNDTFCNAALRDWDSSKNRGCKCRRDARDNERFEPVCSEEEYFLPCTAVDDWVSLFQSNDGEATSSSFDGCVHHL
jgi:hypothetical protein